MPSLGRRKFNNGGGRTGQSNIGTKKTNAMKTHVAQNTTQLNISKAIIYLIMRIHPFKITKLVSF